MTEHQEELYEGNTPEERLIQYKWAITELDIEGGNSDAEEIYRNAILKLSDLLESHVINDAHRRSVLMGQFVPGPFFGRVGGEGFDDWLRHLRLIPIRLLDQELPPIEKYTDWYLCEAFATALSEDPSHRAACIASGNNESCSSSENCPARVVHAVGLRQLEVLFFALYTCDPEETEDIERVQEAIANLSHRLKLYNLADDETLNGVKYEMFEASADFFKAIHRSQHNESD